MRKNGQLRLLLGLGKKQFLRSWVKKLSPYFLLLGVYKRCRICAYVVGSCCRDRLFAEIRVLKQLKHKNIMTFYDSWLDQKTYSVNFITEMFTSGTLRQYVPHSCLLVHAQAAALAMQQQHPVSAVP